MGPSEGSDGCADCSGMISGSNAHLFVNDKLPIKVEARIVQHDMAIDVVFYLSIKSSTTRLDVRTLPSV